MMKNLFSKKILFILLGLLITVGTFGVSYAWFQGYLEHDGTKITTGKIDCDITGYYLDSSDQLQACTKPYKTSPDASLSYGAFVEVNEVNLATSSDTCDFYYLVQKSSSSIDLDYKIIFDLEGSTTVDLTTQEIEKTVNYLGGYWYKFNEVTNYVNFSNVTPVQAVENYALQVEDDKENEVVRQETTNFNEPTNITKINQESSLGTLTSTNSYKVYRLTIGYNGTSVVRQYTNRDIRLRTKLYSAQLGALDDTKGTGNIITITTKAQLQNVLKTYLPGDTLVINGNIEFESDLTFLRPVNLRIVNCILTVKGNLTFEFVYDDQMYIDTSSNGELRVVKFNGSGGQILINTPKSKVEVIGKGEEVATPDIFVQNGFYFDTNYGDGTTGLIVTGSNIYNTYADGSIPTSNYTYSTLYFSDYSKIIVGPNTYVASIKPIINTTFGTSPYVVRIENNGTIGAINLSDMVNSATNTYVNIPQIYIESSSQYLAQSIILPTWSLKYHIDEDTNSYVGNTRVIQRIGSTYLQVTGPTGAGCFTDADIEREQITQYVIDLSGSQQLGNDLIINYVDNDMDVNTILSLLEDYYDGINSPYTIQQNLNRIHSLQVYTYYGKALTDADYATFKRMTDIVTLDLENCDTENGLLKTGTFAGYEDLKYLKLPKGTKQCQSDLFDINTKVFNLYIPKACTTFTNTSFRYVNYIHYQGTTPYDFASILGNNVKAVFEPEYLIQAARANKYGGLTKSFPEATINCDEDTFYRVNGNNQYELVLYIGEKDNLINSQNEVIFTTFKDENGDIHNIESICDYAFYNYFDDLNKTITLVFNQECKNIGQYAFYDSNAVKTIDMSRTTAFVVGDYCFYNNENLETVYFTQINGTLGQSTFASCANFKTTGEEDNYVNLNGVVNIGKNCFFNDNKIYKMYGPFVENLATYALDNMDYLYELDLPNLKTAGYYAIICDRLKYLTIGPCQSITNYINSPVKVFFIDLSRCTWFAAEGKFENYNIVDLNLVKSTASIELIVMQDEALEGYTTSGTWRLTTIGTTSGNKVFTGGSYVFDSTYDMGEFIYYVDIDDKAVLLKSFRTEVHDNAFETPSTITNGTGDDAVAYEVKTIDNYAYLYTKFYGTNIKIGNNTKSINKYAFHRTILEAQPTIDFNEVENIGEYAFYQCTMKTIICPNVKNVYQYAFYNCPKLEDVTMNNGLYIGQYAFYDCDKIKYFTGNLMESVDEWAFVSCDALIEAKFPLLTTLGQHAFYACHALEVANYPNVSYISIRTADNNSRCFYDCPKLQYCILGPIYHCGGNLFGASGNIKLVVLCGQTSENHADATKYYICDWISGIDTSKCLVMMSDSLYQFNPSFTGRTKTYNLGECGGEDLVYLDYYNQDTETYTKLLPEYIYLKTSETTAKLVASTKVLYSETNYSIPSTITDGDGTYDVTEVGDYAFEYSGLNVSGILSFGDNVTKIGNYSFYTTLVSNGQPTYPHSFNKIDFNNVTIIGDYAFKNQDVKEITTDHVLTVGKHAFYNCQVLTDVTLPVATSIDEYAFYHCYAMEYFTAPEVLTVGQYAFSEDSALIKADMPKLTTIGPNAFYICSSLEIAYYPNLVRLNERTDMYADTFNTCSRLKYVVIGPWYHMGANAFANCNNVRLFIVNGKPLAESNDPLQVLKYNPYPTSNAIYVMADEMYAFYNNTNAAKYYSSSNDYSDSTLDSLILTDYYDFDESYEDHNTSLPEYIYLKTALDEVKLLASTQYAYNVENYTILDTVEDADHNVYNITEVGANAFRLSDMTVTNTLTIGANVLEIGDKAFTTDLAKIRSFNIVNFANTKVLGKNLFEKTDIQSFTALHVETINEYCFNNCKQLTNINLPACITIGDYAFQQCSLIERVTAPNCTSVGRRCFFQNSKLIKADMEELTRTAYESFSECSVLEVAYYPKLVYMDGEGTYAYTFLYCYKLAFVAIGPYYYSQAEPINGCPNLKLILIFGNTTTDHLDVSKSKAINVLYGVPSCNIAMSDSMYNFSLSSSSYSRIYKLGSGGADQCILSDYYLLDDTFTEKIPEFVYYKTSSNTCKLVFDTKADITTTNLALADTVEVEVDDETSLTYNVTEIGERAFRYTTLNISNKLTVGEHVTTIYENAFYGETNSFYKTLNKVDLKNTQTIGNNAFKYSTVTEVTAEEVLTIGENAFNSCKQLTYFYGDKTTSIGDHCFNYCSVLIEAKMESLTTLGYCALANCPKMERAYYPKAVYFGMNGNNQSFTFAEDARLAYAVIGPAYYIGLYVFSNCQNMKLILIHGNTDTRHNDSSISKIYNYTADRLAACPILMSQSMYALSNTFGNNAYMYNLGINGAEACVFDGSFYPDETYQEHLNAVPSYAYVATGATTAKFVVAVNRDINVTNLNLFDTITIDETTYNVTEIQAKAFYYSKVVVTGTLTVGEHVETIGDNAFIANGTTYTHSIKNFNLKNTKYISENAFRNLDVETVLSPEVVSFGDYCFNNCQSLQSITAPKCTYVGNFAFTTCKAMTYFTANNVTEIGQECFESCSSLIEAKMESLVKVGYAAFIYDVKLERAYYPHAVYFEVNTSNNSNTFYNCKRLSFVAIGPAYYIGNQFVYDTGSIKLFMVYGQADTRHQDPLVSKVLDYTLYLGNCPIVMSDSMFQVKNNISYNANVYNLGAYSCEDCYFDGEYYIDSTYATGSYVPKFVYVKQAGTTNAGAFVCASSQSLSVTNLSLLDTIPNGDDTPYNVTSIYPKAFALANVTITGTLTVGEYVETIGDNAFKKMSDTFPHSIKNFDLQNTKYVGNNAFEKLDVITIDADEVLTFGNYAFNSCPNLTTISTSKCLGIGDYAFFTCPELLNITCPECLSVGNFAFQNDTKLISFTGNKVKLVGEQSFRGCTSLIEAKMESVEKFGFYTFGQCSSMEVAYYPNAVYFGMGTSNNSSTFYQCTRLNYCVIGPAYYIGNDFLNGTAVRLFIINGQADTVHQDVTVSRYDNFNGGCGNALVLMSDSLLQLYTTKFAQSNTDRFFNLGTSGGENCVFIGSHYTDSTYQTNSHSLPNYVYVTNGTISKLVCSVNPSIAEANINLEDYVTVNEVNYNVTEIYPKAFWFSKVAVTGTLTVGEYVETIGDNAFKPANTTLAHSIKNFDLKNTKYIGNNAFENLDMVTCAASEVVTYGNYAFNNCPYLTSITSPDCTTIGDYTFQSCIALQYFTGNNVTTVGNQAFYNCLELIEAKMESVERMGYYAFYLCTKLERAYYPNCVYFEYDTNNNSLTFNQCYRLLYVTIGPVYHIGNTFIYNNGSPTRLFVVNGTTNENHNDSTNVKVYNYLGYLDNSIILMSDSMYQLLPGNASNKTRIYNLGSVGGDQCLLDGSYYADATYQSHNVSLPEYVYVNNGTIGKFVCSVNPVVTATDLTLKDTITVGTSTVNVTEIYPKAMWFSKVAVTGTLTVGEYVETIGDDAFTQQNTTTLSHSIKNLNLKNTLYIGNNAFKALDVVTCEADDVLTIGNYAFYNCNLLTGFEALDCTSVGDEAFRLCSSLVYATMPEVVTFGYGVFFNCEVLEKAYFPKAEYFGMNTSKNSDTFAYCHNLVYATLGPIYYMGADTFFECPMNLLVFCGTIDPTHVDKTIYNYTFNMTSCPIIMSDEIYQLKTDISSNAYIFNLGAFNGNDCYFDGAYYTDATHQAHGTSVPNYVYAKTATGAKLLVSVNKIITATDITLLDTVTIGSDTINVNEIGERAFVYSKVTVTGTLTVGVNVETISANAFKAVGTTYTHSIKNIDLKNTKYINNNAFEGLDVVTCQASNVVTFGENAFLNCKYLTTISSSSVCTSVGNNAFQNCIALLNFSAPIATSIGNNAFQTCTELTYFNGPEVTTIGNYAFNGCLKLISASMPKLTTAGHRAFLTCPLLEIADYPLLVNFVRDTSNVSGTFSGCTKLAYASVGAYYTAGTQVFESCANLKLLLVNGSTNETHTGAEAYANNIKSSAVSTAKVCMSTGMQQFDTFTENQYSYDAGSYADQAYILLNFYTLTGYVTTNLLPEYVYSITSSNTASLLCNTKAEVTGSDLILDDTVSDGTNSYQVTLIQNNAFRYSKLSFTGDLKVSQNIETIGSYAFHSSTNFEKTFKNAYVYNCETIGDFAFYSNDKLEYLYGDNVTSAGQEAFNSCLELIEAHMEKLETAGYALFHNCKKLENAYYPNCTYFGYNNDKYSYTFAYCNRLKYITIGPVYNIGNRFIYDNAYATRLFVVTGNAGETHQDASLLKIYNYLGYMEQGIILMSNSMYQLLPSDVSNKTRIYNLGSVGGDQCYFDGSYYADATYQSHNISLPEYVYVNDGTTGKFVCTVNTLESKTDLTLKDTITVGTSTVNVTEIYPQAMWFSKVIITGTLTVGANVTTIGEKAFKQLDAIWSHSIKNIDLKNVTTINESAFEGLDIVTCTTDDVTTIGVSAFKTCKNLVEINAPLCTECKDFAFNGCSALIEAEMPLLEKIGTNCFESCTSLERAVYTNLVCFASDASGNSYTFSGCSKLAYAAIGAYYYAGKYVFNSTGNLRLLLVYGDTNSNHTDASKARANSLSFSTTALVCMTTNMQAFDTTAESTYRAYNAGNFNGQTYILSDYYKVNSSYTKEIPGLVYSVTSPTTATLLVDSRATYSTTNLILPDTVSNTTGTYNVTAIQDNAFRYGQLTVTNNFEVGQYTESIGNYAFYGVDASMETYLKNVNLKNVLTLGNEAFRKTTAEIVTANKVTTMGNCVFQDNNKLQYFYGNDVVSAGYFTFYYCSVLLEAVMPNIESIGYQSFDTCSLLEAAIYPKLVVFGRNTSDQSNTFSHCKRLKNVAIGPVYDCGLYLFNDTGSVRLLMVYGEQGTNHQTYGNAKMRDYTYGLSNLVVVMSDSMYNFYQSFGQKDYTIKLGSYKCEDCILVNPTQVSGYTAPGAALPEYVYVKEGTTAKLATAVTYNINATNYAMDSTVTDSTGTYPVTAIGDYAFRYTTIAISNNLTLSTNMKTIGSYVFQTNNTTYPHSIKNVDLKTTETLGDYCFNKVDVVSITANSLKTIGEHCFEECTALTEANLPLCETINNKGFYKCSALTKVNAPKCTYIDREVFAECQLMYECLMPDLETAGYESFYNCYALEKAIYPKLTNFINGTGTRSPNLTLFCYCRNLIMIQIGNFHTTGIELTFDCPQVKLMIIGGFQDANHTSEFTSTRINPTSGVPATCKVIISNSMYQLASALTGQVFNVGTNDPSEMVYTCDYYVNSNYQAHNSAIPEFVYELLPDGTYRLCCTTKLTYNQENLYLENTVNDSQGNAHNVTEIREKAFYYSTMNITGELRIGANVKTIGVSAFDAYDASHTKTYTTLNLQSGVKTLCDRAFYDNNITFINEDNTVEEIKKHSFYSVNNIRKFVFPEAKILGIRSLSTTDAEYIYVPKTEILGTEDTDSYCIADNARLVSLVIGPYYSSGKSIFSGNSKLQNVYMYGSQNTNHANPHKFVSPITNLGGQCQLFITNSMVQYYVMTASNRFINTGTLDPSDLLIVGSCYFDQSYQDHGVNIGEYIVKINDNVNHKASIVRYNAFDNTGDASGNYTILDTFQDNSITYTLDTVEPYAFTYAKINLTGSLTFPSSYTLFRDHALSSTVAAYPTMGKNLYIEGAAKLEQYSFESTKFINIYSNTVYQLDFASFYKCPNLEFIKLMAVQTMGSDVFSTCPRLAVAYLQGLQSTSYNTFTACKNLRNVFICGIPDAVNTSITTYSLLNGLDNKNVHIFMCDILAQSFTATTKIVNTGNVDPIDCFFVGDYYLDANYGTEANIHQYVYYMDGTNAVLGACKLTDITTTGNYTISDTVQDSHGTTLDVTSIGNYAYNNVTMNIGGTLSFGDKITKIGQYAFHNNNTNCYPKTFNNIDFNNVTKVDKYSFYGDTINTIASDNILFEASDYAFYGVQSLYRFDSTTLKVVGYATFNNMASLEEFYAPYLEYCSATYSSYIWANDPRLVRVTISSMHNVGHYPFEKCPKLEQLIICNNPSMNTYTNVTDYVPSPDMFKNSNATLANVKVFMENKTCCTASFGTECTIVYTDNVNPINMVFMGSRYLDSTYQAHGTNLGEYAYCKKSDNTYAFAGYLNGATVTCNATQDFVVSNTVNIGGNNYQVTEVFPYAYKNINIQTTGNLVIQSGITKIGEYAFYSHDSINHDYNQLVLNDVDYIGKYAFYKNQFTTFDHNNNVTLIDSHAFELNNALTEVYLPDLVEARERVFMDCPNIIEVYMPSAEKLTSNVNNDSEMFYNDIKIVKATLGPIYYIKDWVFRNCPNLKYIIYCGYSGAHHIPADSCYTWSIISDYRGSSSELFTFISDDLYSKVTTNVYVGNVVKTGAYNPKDLVFVGNNYRGTTVNFGAYVYTVDTTNNSAELIKYIGPSINDPSMTLTLPTQVNSCNLTSIAANCFKYNSNEISVSVKKLVLPATVTNVGDNAFTRVLFEEFNAQGLVTIGANAFELNSKLTSLTLPEVTTIATYAFKQNTSLTMVKFDKIVTIGTNAFNGCTNLGNIYLGESIATIDNNAFSSINVAIDIYIHNYTSVVPGATNVFASSNGYKQLFVDYRKIDDYQALATWNTIPSAQMHVLQPSYDVDDFKFYYTACNDAGDLEIVLIDGDISSLTNNNGIYTLTIPSIIDGHNVVKLTNNSFMAITFDDSQSVELLLPSTLSSFELLTCSFSNIISSFVLNANDEYNEYYCTVSGVLYDTFMQVLISYPKNNSNTSFTIPSGVIVNEHSFDGCKNLQTINIGMNSSVYVMSYAFANMPSLQTITIGRSSTVVFAGQNTIYGTNVQIIVPRGSTYLTQAKQRVLFDEDVRNAMISQ